MSTIWREAFPPPRRLLTTSLGVISFGSSRASEGDTALCDFANGLRGKGNFIPGRQIQRIRKAVKDVLAFSEALHALSPIGGARSAQQHEHCLFPCGLRAKHLARLQAPDEKAHPVPARLLARQMQKFTSLLRRQNRRMEEKTAFAHISPALSCSFPQPKTRIRLTALRLWQMDVALSIVHVTNSDSRPKEPAGSPARRFTSDFLSMERSSGHKCAAPQPSPQRSKEAVPRRGSCR